MGISLFCLEASWAVSWTSPMSLPEALMGLLMAPQRWVKLLYNVKIEHDTNMDLWYLWGFLKPMNSRRFREVPGNSYWHSPLVRRQVIAKVNHHPFYIMGIFMGYEYDSFPLGILRRFAVFYWSHSPFVEISFEFPSYDSWWIFPVRHVNVYQSARG